MKKLILLLLIATILTGCAKGKPKDMRQEVYDQGLIAYDVTNNYLNGSGSGSRLQETISGCIDVLQDMDDTAWRLNEKLESIKLVNELISMNLIAIDLDLNENIGQDNTANKEKLKKELKGLKKLINK